MTHKASIGTCDVCEAENVEVCHCIVSGIDTWACDECRMGSTRVFVQRDRARDVGHAAIISLLAEGVAVTMFLSMGFVWLAIYGTR